MRSYGEIEVTRSGALAMSLETKKLRLQPPVPTAGGKQAAAQKVVEATSQRSRAGAVVRKFGAKCQDAFTKKTETWIT
jgi:hypothetical protein